MLGHVQEGLDSELASMESNRSLPPPVAGCAWPVAMTSTTQELALILPIVRKDMDTQTQHVGA
jgi:hypothetical protein